MIQQRLYEWIRHPEYLNKDSLSELRGLLARYPYFQTVRLLYLKNLFLLQDSSFKEELRKSALYISDLSVLFYYIEGERLVIKQHASEKERPEGKASSDRTLDLIDRFLSDLSEEPAMELPLPAEVSVDYTSILLQEPDEVSDKPLMKGQELIDSFIEKSKEVSAPTSVPADPLLQEPEDNLDDKVKDSDSEEVNLPATDPSEEHLVKGNLSTTEITESDDLRTTDKTEEESSVSQRGIEEQDNDLDESYFTETLAKIYVKQQRYDKALEIIKKLNLKYPKKNAYFADQIRFLEKLIINAKSK